VERAPVVLGLGSGNWRVAYEGVMLGLALLVVVLLPFDASGPVGAVNLAIWAVFVGDYALRLVLSTDRRAFLRANIVDLVAIMPADLFRVARVLRIVRLIRVVRAASVVTRVARDIRGLGNTNGLKWLLLATAGSVLLGAAVVWQVEPSIARFSDAVWWAFVTATTVGYGDLSPENGFGRVVAIVLMLVGIGTIGMLTGSIATYFLGDLDRDTVPPDVSHVRARLADWATLSGAERRGLAALLAELAGEGVGQDDPRLNPPSSSDH
jgi:voltage-gated potassium channel